MHKQATPKLKKGKGPVIITSTPKGSHYYNKFVETKKKFIYRTEDEVTKIIEKFEEEIEMYENEIKSGDQVSYIKKIFKQMIDGRKERIKELKSDKFIFKSKKTVKAYKGRTPFATLDLKGCTFSEEKSELFFLTGRYKNGFFLGFYSRDPWGTTRDREQGWGVIDPYKLELVESCESKSYGQYTGEAVHCKKRWKEKYGKLTKLTDVSGEPHWKITEQ